MKRFLALLSVLLLIAPLAGAQPYVTVFQGRLPMGGTLKVDGYALTLTSALNGSPYIVLRRGNDVLELRPFEFGGTIELEDVRVTMGSYTPEGGFLVVSVRPRFVTSLEPKPGAKATINGTLVEVTGVSNGTVGVSINGVERTLKANESTVFDLIALEYDGEVIKVYAAEPARETVGSYTVFYPYRRVRTSGPLDVPITITSSSGEELTIQLGIISMPDGWKAKFLYGNVEVGEITIPPGGTVGLTLHVEPMGSGTITFAVGSFVGTLRVENTGISVYLPYRSVEAEAGENISLPVSFSGSGTAQFEPVGVPPGWGIYLTDGRYRLRSFEVRGSFSASLVVEIPRNATLGKHTLQFSINGKVYGLDVYVYKTYLGQPAKLTVILRDESGNPVRGWVAIGGRNVTAFGSTTFELKPGQYTLRAGGKGCVPVEKKVILADGEEKRLEITLMRAEYYFEASLEHDALTVTPGSPSSVLITVKNLGSKDDEYRITVSDLPSGWSYVVSQDQKGSIPLGSLKVRSGESGSAYLVLFPPFNVESGDFSVKVIVSGTGVKRELPLRVHVENPATLDLNAERPFLTVKAGGATSTTLTLEAIGTVTNIKFRVQAPKGWDVEVIPPTIPRVGVVRKGNVEIYPGPVTAELRIRVPKSTPAGTYTVTVTAVGDQARAETVVTVRVIQGSSGVWLGVVILVLAFGVVIWLMRRVGRR